MLFPENLDLFSCFLKCFQAAMFVLLGNLAHAHVFQSCSLYAQVTTLLLFSSTVEICRDCFIEKIIFKIHKKYFNFPSPKKL